MRTQETNSGSLELGEVLRSSSTDYRLEKVLGLGGFGITYLARDLNTGQERAIKEFFPRELAVRASNNTVQVVSSDGDIREAFDKTYRDFWRESEILKSINHPNVVEVFDAFQANNTAYLVMEFIAGESLAQRLNRAQRAGTPLSWGELSSIINGVLDGLDKVHATQQMHRDLKPSNIMLRDDGTPVLIDFGSARAFDPNRSAPLTQLFTQGYSAPEAQFSQGTFASDIYSAAVVFHECVTLSRRRPEENLLDLHRRRRLIVDPSVSDAFESPSQFEGFLSAIDEGTLQNPEARPRNVRSFRANLFPDGVAPDRGDRPARAQKPAKPLLKKRAAEFEGASGDAPRRRQSMTMAMFIGVPMAALVAAVFAVVFFAPRLVADAGQAIQSIVAAHPPSPATSTGIATTTPPPITDAAAAFRQAQGADTQQGWTAFINTWGNDPNAAAAQTRLATLQTQDNAEWTRISATPTAQALSQYLSNRKYFIHQAEARVRLAELRAMEDRSFEAARAQGTQAALVSFINDPTTFFHANEARTLLQQAQQADTAAWQAASNAGLCEVSAYLDPAAHRELHRSEATTRQSQLIAADDAQWARVGQDYASAQSYLQQQPCGRHRQQASLIGRGPRLLQPFNDNCGPGCPNMVAVRGGANGFAVSQTEITNAQWRACVAAGRCTAKSGPDNYPVTNVSLSEAQRFTAWLSSVTGQTYSIPSSSQWEFAARGGTTTPWWSGDNLTSAEAVCADCGASLPTGPSSVGGRRANRYNLYDVAGNVFEWTTDCSGGCIIRGGSYFNSKLHAQSSFTADRVPPTQQAPTLGFRVVRAVTLN